MAASVRKNHAVCNHSTASLIENYNNTKDI